MHLTIQKLRDDAILPTRAYVGDAGLDIYACDDIAIQPGKQADIPTGIALHIPEGHVGLVWDKSGIAFKHHLKTMGGVIDASFRGELRVCLANLGEESYIVQKGSKVAQLLIQPFVTPDVVEGMVDTETDRGGKGFGSSGR